MAKEPLTKVGSFMTVASVAEVIAMATGSLPTVIGGPAALVAVAIGVTVPDS